jgi:hypothetical protein
MAKELAKIYVVFQRGDKRLLVATIVLRGHDLYTVKHLFPIRGKHSYHESGAFHSFNELLGLREPGGRGFSLRGLRGYVYVTGFGYGRPLEMGDYQTKSDRPRTRTFIIPAPENVWGLDVWAIEKSRPELVDKIKSTLPWPESEIVGYFSVDWTDPLILVTIWHGIVESPYQVVKLSPPIPGEIPFVLIPEKWANTWLYDSSKTTPARQRMQRAAEEFIRRKGNEA